LLKTNFSIISGIASLVKLATGQSARSAQVPDALQAEFIKPRTWPKTVVL
jgi:hypothetical protein